MYSGPMIPPSVVQSWPKPNHVNPANSTVLVLGVEIPIAVLMTLAIVARFYSRAITRRVLGWDDWFMALAYCCVLACSIVVWSGIKYGLGMHMWDQEKGAFPIIARGVLAVEVFFAMGPALTKIAICLTYLQLFPQRKSNKYFCRIAIAYCICSAVGFFFLALLQCGSGLSDYWHIHKTSRKCLDEQSILISAAAFNAVSDLAVFLWPVRFLWDLKLSVRKRLELIGLFSFGCLICVVTCVRMWYFSIMYKPPFDLSWACTRCYVLMAVETNLGVVCGCLTCCKPALQKTCPYIFGKHKSSKYSNSPRRYGGGGGGDQRQYQLENLNHKGNQHDPDATLLTVTVTDDSYKEQPVLMPPPQSYGRPLETFTPTMTAAQQEFFGPDASWKPQVRKCPRG